MEASDSQYKYTLFLISPRQKYVNYSAQTETAVMLGKKRFMLPLAIPVIAALTPSHYRIRIIDEEIEPVPDELPDLVGITTLSATVLQAYRIADHYRSRGVKVVLGGAYVSFMPEEALQHADAVVVGEAEDLWPICLRDFEENRLQTIYRSGRYCEYRNCQPPRWDLVNKNHYLNLGVQVSRGCPFSCEFCLVNKLFGHKMRYREVDNVIEELKSLPFRKVFFTDENLTVNRKYAFELTERMKPLNIAWSCMASIDVAEDAALLEAMADSGCYSILIGFESLNPDSLDETHKKHNLSATIYEQAVRKIHEAGIHIFASFAIGFDHDTPQEFEKIYEFTSKTGLSYINFNILGAPPGSALYNRLKKEGRWYDICHDYRSGLFPTLHYNKMSQSELFDGYMKTIEKLFSYKTIYEKVKVLFGNGYFNRKYHDNDTTAAFKFRATMLILKHFAFSRNLYKRKIFTYLLKLVLRRRTVIDKASSYMLSMLSYHNHIKEMKNHLDEYRAIVKQYDKGSWEHMQAEKNQLQARGGTSGEVMTASVSTPE